MSRSIISSLEQFYGLIAQLARAQYQGRHLRDLPGRAFLPSHGVYFFTEPTEFRAGKPTVPRIVRVGTHAVSIGSKATLRGRLKQHFGTRAGGGNHRGSIFRLHVGAALLARDGPNLPTWGVGSSAPAAVRDCPSTRAAELACERLVSDYLGAMSVLWIDVPDEAGPQSDRAFIERNAIALLSNHFSPCDCASESWLGRFSPRLEIRESSLWNLNHVAECCDINFLKKFELYVRHTCEAEPRTKA